MIEQEAAFGFVQNDKCAFGYLVARGQTQNYILKSWILAQQVRRQEGDSFVQYSIVEANLVQVGSFSTKLKTLKMLNLFQIKI